MRMKKIKLGSLKRICKSNFATFPCSDMLIGSVGKARKKSSQSTSKVKEAGPPSSPHQALRKKEKPET